jgi:hypothetical protein
MEEATPLPFEALALRIGVTEVLARPAACPDFAFGDVFRFERGDVAMERNLGPMSLQYLLAVWVDFAVKNGGHASPLEAQVKATNPRKK